jgi:hypothetical protein
MYFFEVREIAPENQSEHAGAIPNKVIWRIDSPAQPHVDQLPPIVYGVVPGGFTQLFPAQGSNPAPLAEGKVYEARSVGGGAPGGSIRFAVRNGHVEVLPKA